MSVENGSIPGGTTPVDQVENEEQANGDIVNGNGTLPQRSRSVKKLKPNSLANIISPKRSRSLKLPSPASTPSSPEDGSNLALVVDNRLACRNGLQKTVTVVSIVLVEAKGLPNLPDDGASHGIYCELRLGNESFKSKTVTNNGHPKWGQRLQFNMSRGTLLQVTLYDKGKQKNFMGCGTLELAELEIERTHEIWLDLQDGFGSVHFSVTMCPIKNPPLPSPEQLSKVEEMGDKHVWYNLNSDWNKVGQLVVKVHRAKGFTSKIHAYCVLELDNERVRTHSASGSTEPMWDKNYFFNVFDVASILHVKVIDSSLFQESLLGRVSIPLLKINQFEGRWFALKDKTRRTPAKGNCPRIYLEVAVVWNPIKASVRMFRPKEVKYIQKPKKFDIALVYSNVEFVRDTFLLLYDLNEGYKRFFEWESREYCAMALFVWLLFWYFARVWMVPLFIIIGMFYSALSRSSGKDEEVPVIRSEEKEPDLPAKQNSKTLTSRISGLPEMTLTITHGIEYMASVYERLENLASFKVPFLSYLTLAILLASSVVLYFVPMNYLLMAFGVFKFGRKFLNPNRTLNNDILDFISHIPDNDMYHRDWIEYPVPEPSNQRIVSSITAPSRDEIVANNVSA